MAEGFTVEFGRLRAHVGEVDDFAGRVDVAADAAGHVAGLDDAYGLICRQLGLPDLLRGPQERAAEALREGASSLHDTAADLNATVAQYEETERRIDDTIRSLLDRLGSLSGICTDLSTTSNGGTVR